jgi:ABC-type Fe3+-hydroxamate transport system substrate-binding protein
MRSGRKGPPRIPEKTFQTFFRSFSLLFIFFILSLGLFLNPSPSHAQSSPYRRIISLKPNLTEILFDLGVGDLIVGVTTFCDHPPEAKKIDKVADYIQPDLEKIIVKNPDLIVTSKENSSRREIDFLIHRGYKVLTFEAEDLEELRDTLGKLGDVLGRRAEAQILIARMDGELLKLKARIEGLRARGEAFPRALFVVGHQPLIVAGGGNIFDEAAAYLGVINVAGKNRFQYPTYSLEMVLSEKPEIILDFSMGSEADEKSQSQILEWWSKYPALPAVKNGRVFLLDMGRMRVTPRLPGEFMRLFDLIHGGKE